MNQTRALRRHLRHLFSPSALARAIARPGLGALAAGALLAVPVAALAQPGAAPVRGYDIPAGPLDEALGRFGSEAGILLPFSPAVTEGLRSPGLRGSYSVEAGLAALLAGTGLQAVRQANGSYALAPAARADAGGGAATLQTVKVTAQGVRDGTTEGTGSYRAGHTATATRLALSPRETPQTVTVVTRQQMDDFGLNSVDDALKATSGVFVYERGNLGSYYFSRGFYLQSQYDGMANPIGISNDNKSPIVDSAFLDRMEVLQGASGLLSGAGYPGGTINLVRKRPTQDFQAQVEVQAGSWNQKRAMADVSGALTASGQVRGRLVALVDYRDSFVDHAFNHRRGLYGAIDADLTPTTLVSASVQYQKDQGRDHSGVPYGADGSDMGFDRSAFFGNPRSRNDKDYALYTLGLEQQLSSGWRMKAAYDHGRASTRQPNDSWLSGSLDRATGNGLSLYQARLFDREVKANTADVFVSGPASFWGRTHEFVLGANVSSAHDYAQASGYLPTAINVLGFDPHALPDPVGGAPYEYGSKTRQKGLYGVARLGLTDALKLIAGTRISWYESRNLVNGVVDQKESGVVSPYAGLVYDLHAQYSVYASYSDIFTPQSQRGVGGGTVKPVVGSNYEVGAKGALLGGRLNATAALFQLDQQNLARQDASVPFDRSNACGGWCYVADDTVRSRGVDLGLNGEIRPGWNVAAGYTYVNSRYASGKQQGERYMSGLPRHSLSIASSQRIAGTGWTLGGSVRAYSSITNTTYHIRRGGLALFGVTAKYQLSPSTDVHAVVDNLFDKRYYATVHNLWYSPFGEPRRFSVSLRHRF